MCTIQLLIYTHYGRKILTDLIIIYVLIYRIFIFGHKPKYIIIHNEWYIVILLN